MPLVRARASRAVFSHVATVASVGTDSHVVASVAMDRGISVFTGGVGAVDCGDALGIHTHSQRCACASCARTRMSMAECACGGVRGSHTSTCVRGRHVSSYECACGGVRGSHTSTCERGRHVSSHETSDVQRTVSGLSLSHGALPVGTAARLVQTGATLESTSAAGAGFAASALGAARLMSSQAAGAAVVDAAPTTLHELPNQQVKVLVHQLLEQLTLDSVKRKRKRKMNKHKYRKRRKATNR